jgi:hypothetical protein
VIGTDLFELKGVTYLLVVDYFSRYPEIAKFTSTTSLAVINVLKSIFARHGIPEVIRSDNGPQYTRLLTLRRVLWISASDKQSSLSSI